MGQSVNAGVPAGVVNLADYEALARERLDEASAAWLLGGAADEVTLRANRAAWDALTLWPRVLRPLTAAHTRVDLLGRTLACPLLVAPVAHQRLVHPQGELGCALAAAAQGAGYVLGTLSSTPLEEVAAQVRDEPGRGPLWFQLYLQHDRGFTRELVGRAERAGYEAIVLTVDAPVAGARDRERRAGFKRPPHVQPVHLTGLPAAPAAVPGAICAGLLEAAPTWDDLAWLRASTRLPIVLKGVLHPADARQAQSLGADALIVSNHGGRTLDSAPASALALPRIADAVGDALPLLVDGGIRRGTDVLKAAALGARAVLVGRPLIAALAVAGPLGVAHAVRLLRDELEMALALTGCASLAEAGRELLG